MKSESSDSSVTETPKERIKFNARLKKVDIFNDTLQIIVFPKGSLKDIARLYEIECGKKIEISISPIND